MPLKILSFYSVAVFAALAGAPSIGWGQCANNLRENLPPFVIHGAAGYSFVGGADGNNIRGGATYQGGAGFFLTPEPDDRCIAKESIPRLRFLVNVNAIGSTHNTNPGLVAETIARNPLIPALLSATNATADFYNAALEPTLRYVSSPRVGVYAFGGFGWFRRVIDFTGSATEGPLLQPGGSEVYKKSNDSGAYDLGAGLDVAIHGRLRAFGEIRFLQGVGVNGSSRLVPLTAGLRW